MDNKKRIARAEKKHGKGCLDEKACLCCGTPMNIRDKEETARFISRDTCSVACGGKLSGIRRREKSRLKVVTRNFTVEAPKKIDLPFIQLAINSKQFGVVRNA